MTWGDRLRALRMDLTPWRASKDFRLLLTAGTVFYLGGMVSYVAIPYQVYVLTGSNLAVGAIGLVELVPLVVFGLYGGALADHVDRRKLLIWTGVAQAVFTAVLAVNAFRDDPSVVVIFVVAAMLASASSMQRPSREALMPRTVPHDQLTAAQALTSFGMQVGILVGPLVGGLLVAYVGIGWCFVVDIVALAVATLLYVAMGSYPHRAETTPPSLRGIGEGLTYALRRRDLLGTYLVDIAAMLLAMPVVLFPALVEEVFETTGAARPALLGRDSGRDGRDRPQRLDVAGPPPRPGHRDRGGRLRRLHRHGRPDAELLAGARLLHPGRLGGHDLRHLPRHGLEPDHPRVDARPPGRHRDAVLLRRSPRWPGPGRTDRRPVVGARGHRQRRRSPASPGWP